jgi:hypothetical protein
LKKLNEILERFSKSLNKDTHTREAIIKAIEEKIGIKIPQENISLKEGVLEIKTTPVVNNEIKLKEESIIARLKEARIHISRIFFK